MSPVKVMSILPVSSCRSVVLNLLGLWIPIKTLMKAVDLSDEKYLFVYMYTEFSIKFKRFRCLLRPQVVHGPKVKNAALSY